MDVKTLCLGVLTLGEASGYEIKKFFEEAFSHFYVAGFGSIYPALAQLAREGYVTCSDIPQEKRPAKKVYRLTESGWACFRRALEETYPGHKVRSDFMVLLVFAHLQGPEQLSRVLQTRLRDIEAQLEMLDSCSGASAQLGPGVEFVTGLARTVLEAGREYIEQNAPALIEALRKEGS